jgi:hypothetical protein
MLNINELTRAKFIVGAKGGEIRAVDAEGTVAWELGLQPGIHDGKEYVQFMGPGLTVETLKGVQAIIPNGGRVQRMNFGKEAFKTAANPDFKPSVADQNMRRLEAKVSGLTRKVDQQERRLKEAQRQEQEVIEDETTEDDQTQDETSKVEDDEKHVTEKAQAGEE